MSMCVGVEELLELVGIVEVAVVGKNDTIGAIHVERLGLCMGRGSSSGVSHCSTRSRYVLAMFCGEGKQTIPCPMPIEPINRLTAFFSKTSLTIPFALH